MYKVLKIMKKIKIRNLIILILLLVFNAYAWFVYTTRVSLDLSAHVSSWDVQFVAKDGGISSDMIIKVENFYTGMEDFEKIIEVQNRGEVNVELSYEIESVRIMDETIEKNDETGVTSESIEEKLKNDYPFKINIVKDDSNLITGSGNGSFKITVVWPYESGDDEKDTYWGEKAYDYSSANPEKSSLHLELLLIAEQKNKDK